MWGSRSKFWFCGWGMQQWDGPRAEEQRAHSPCWDTHWGFLGNKPVASSPKLNTGLNILQRPPLSPSTPVSGYQRVAQSPPVISESPAHAWPSPTHLHKSTYRLFEQHSPTTSNHLCGDAPSPPARGTRSAPVPLYPAPSRLLGPPATAASSTPAHWARPRAAGGRAGPGAVERRAANCGAPGSGSGGAAARTCGKDGSGGSGAGADAAPRWRERARAPRGCPRCDPDAAAHRLRRGAGVRWRGGRPGGVQQGTAVPSCALPAFRADARGSAGTERGRGRLRNPRCRRDGVGRAGRARARPRLRGTASQPLAGNAWSVAARARSGAAPALRVQTMQRLGGTVPGAPPRFGAAPSPRPGAHWPHGGSPGGRRAAAGAGSFCLGVFASFELLRARMCDEERNCECFSCLKMWYPTFSLGPVVIGIKDIIPTFLWK